MDAQVVEPADDGVVEDADVVTMGEVPARGCRHRGADVGIVTSGAFTDVRSRRHGDGRRPAVASAQ